MVMRDVEARFWRKFWGMDSKERNELVLEVNVRGRRERVSWRDVSIQVRSRSLSSDGLLLALDNKKLI